MQKIDGPNAKSQSADLMVANIEQLKGLFPEVITEGPNGAAVNLDALKLLVGDQIATDAEERYGLNWHGKRRARQLALTPSTGTLRPCQDESVNWDGTQNLMIEGDNLEVLKLLQKSYAGQVKLIYIDPPYNTGKDFVYPDNFHDNIKNYLELTNQLEGGKKISSNAETGGRFHTAWLNMIYPRIKLARSLLRDDGVIFISIDDGEFSNLRSICSEIFGEENFVATFVWEKRTSRENRKIFSFNHDFILAFAKNVDSFQKIRGFLPFTDDALQRYSNPDNDPRGEWQSVALSVQGGHGTASQFYEITTPGGRSVNPPSGLCWRFTKLKLNDLIHESRIWFGADGNNVPRLKLFLTEANEGLTPHTLWKADEVGTTDSGKRELLSLFGGDSVFDTVKPTSLIQRILQIATKPDQGDIVLDFFAGSGSSAHAVISQNASDTGNRRCISVQLPEPIDPSTPEGAAGNRLCDDLKKPRNLAEICKERLRRAAKKVASTPPSLGVDPGFKVFKLDYSNLRAWNPDADALEQSLFSQQDHLIENRTEFDVLYEILIKLGLDLCVHISNRTVVGKAVYSVGGGVLMACLDKHIEVAEVEAVAQGIATWRNELAPASDTTCVFRDSAFANDVAKTNMAAILEQNGILAVRSL